MSWSAEGLVIGAPQRGRTTSSKASRVEVREYVVDGRKVVVAFDPAGELRWERGQR